ncbi:MAG TPA: ABC transporter substrate-binding protein [Bauldia sp.]|nr:ABC transporter substrate-binding protein [Bauldia sp.]
MKRIAEDVLKAAPGGLFVRRDVLRFGAASAAFIVASKIIGKAGPAFGAEVGGPLNLFTWQGYDLTDTFKQWRADHNIQQTQKYINNQFDVVSILKGPGGKDFDSSSSNQAYTHLFQRLDLMAPLSAADVPSLAKMYPFFKDSPIWKTAPDADTYNSVPWTWGAIGINYLTDKVPAPDSWNVLIDPKNRGRVATYDDAYNNVSVAAIALGIDLTHITHDALNGPIKDWLTKLKQNAKAISTNIGDQQTLLVNKEVDYMSIGLTLISAGAKSQGAANVGFGIPKEGGFGFCDAAFLTPWAPDRENALAFLEALLGGQTAADAAINLAQGVAVPDVVPLLDDATRALYPYDTLNDYLTKQLKFEVNFTPEAGQDIVSFDEINALWEQIKAS